MKEQEVLKLLKDTNALMEGHFVLTSGLHSAKYVEKFRLLEQPKITEKLCHVISEKFKDKNISVVIGPMTGGIILAHAVGKFLGSKSYFTERENGKMKLKRGFKLGPDDNVLVVEDIITTGSSVKEVLDVIKQFESNIVGICSLVDRSNNNVTFDYVYQTLLSINIETYKPGECPLCVNRIPITKPGSTNK